MEDPGLESGRVRVLQVLESWGQVSPLPDMPRCLFWSSSIAAGLLLSVGCCTRV